MPDLLAGLEEEIEQPISNNRGLLPLKDYAICSNDDKGEIKFGLRVYGEEYGGLVGPEALVVGDGMSKKHHVNQFISHFTSKIFETLPSIRSPRLTISGTGPSHLSLDWSPRCLRKGSFSTRESARSRHCRVPGWRAVLLELWPSRLSLFIQRR